MGGKRATTTSSVSIPPEVLARYNAVNQQAQTAAATPYEAFGKTAADYVAPINAQQGAGISDINATAGSYQPYMDKATSATQAGMGPASEGIDRYMSPYIKNVADTTGAYMRQQQEQAQSGALGSAISSGAFGGDRAGIAAANLQQQNQMGYGKTMADILNQGYTQALGASQADLARQMQGGAQMAGLGAQSQQLGLQGAQAKIAAGTMQQQTEQAGKDAMINQFMQEKGYPFQVAQFLANIAMGTGAASGSTTTTQTPRNWLGFASGGAVGGGVAGPRTYTQSGVGGVGYVPAADLPVGQLMTADPPEQSQSNGTDEIIKIISMVSGSGAKNGGAIDQRHGYALDGGVADGPVWNAYTKKYEVGPNTPVVVEKPTGVNRDATGVVIPKMHPDRQFSRGTPLLTQADYGMSEPEFKNYTSRKYNTPAEAAVGANDYYEMAGKGVGDAAAIQHANRISTAIQNGGEGLMPNELALYNHYKEKGWNDDNQIAGMIGRFNVEAGEGINPNARNTLGGGYGTYGIMQARGPRFEKLAAAGGLSPETLEAMPVTNGLSSGVAGGDNLNTNISTMDSPRYANLGDPLHMDKPYEDRNFIGKFFHNRDGSLNSNAVMALLGGLAKGAEAQTISPLGGILSGLGGGMETYKGLVKQAADVEATNLANVQNAMKNYSYAVYNGMTDMSWPEYAAQQGIDLTALRGVPTLMGQPPVKPITVADTRSFVTRNVNGVDIKIPFMQDFESLNNLINQNIGAQSDPSNPMSSVVQQAIARRDEIAKTGTTVGKDQFGNDVVYKDPTAFGAITTETERQNAADRNERFGASSEAFSSSAPVVDNSINELTNILTTVSPGITNPLIALGDSLGSAFGLTSGDYAAKTQAALAKSLEPMIADAMSGNMTGPAAEALAQVRSQLMSPTMQPGAIRDSIATARAVIDYQRAAYDEYYNKGGQNAPDVMGDPMKFMQKYEKEHPFAKVKEKYMDYHVTPPLLGEPAPPEYLALPNTSQDMWNKYPTQTKIEMLDSIAQRAAENQGG